MELLDITSCDRDGNEKVLWTNAPAAVPPVPDGGNTITPSEEKKEFKENPCRSWCFTLFKYTEGMIDLMSAECVKIGAKFIFGREICPKTSKKHLQCYIKFKGKERKRLETVIKRFIPHYGEVHKEPGKGSLEENFEYCSKEGSFRSNITMIHVKRHIQVPYEDLRQWQQDAHDEILDSGANDRTIIWIRDQQGNSGKSFLARWLVNEYQGLMTQGSKRHVLSAAFNNPETRLYIFDVPRVVGNNVSYETIENLRNGLFFSGFGDSTGMVNLGFSPIVVVLANKYPNLRRLSMDRWKVFDIHHEYLIEKNIEEIDSDDDDY